MHTLHLVQRCGASGADDTYCLDGCSGYEGEVAVDDFKYRYYTVRAQEFVRF